jgi:hypothetical protein
VWVVCVCVCVKYASYTNRVPRVVDSSTPELLWARSKSRVLHLS